MKLNIWLCKRKGRNCTDDAWLVEKEREAGEIRSTNCYLRPDGKWWNSGYRQDLERPKKEFLKCYFNSPRWAVAYIKKNFPKAKITVRA